ncbi:OB-fold nucleic acid binding domain-containing protein [Arthrobacter sp. zg-ZUI100]|uniref:OB-fold nucleic acid binding domain-containing protein n=1 Tax=Arthrobacter jiangjiafuii TaxID=2817475 RepID=UPI001AEEDD34|nr:OB-fold nucleic acid binding domain-containing protein [Arthrobacter jiangjiafuii]MBP3036780.1 OB-fold nucleic acid binding domain-containing protein [Arthrobacter jiangjiafuii]
MAPKRAATPSGTDTPVPVSAMPARGRVYSGGYVQSITVVPATEPPRFTAMVEDPGAAYRDPLSRKPVARVRLVWVGQRRVPGVEAGTRLAFEGMVSTVDSYPTIYNPRYEIIGRPEDES